MNERQRRVKCGIHTDHEYVHIIYHSAYGGHIYADRTKRVTYKIKMTSFTSSTGSFNGGVKFMQQGSNLHGFSWEPDNGHAMV
jgi:hypothetical protein